MNLGATGDTKIASENAACDMDQTFTGLRNWQKILKLAIRASGEFWENARDKEQADSMCWAGSFISFHLDLLSDIGSTLVV